MPSFCLLYVLAQITPRASFWGVFALGLTKHIGSAWMKKTKQKKNISATRQRNHKESYKINENNME